MKLNPEKCAFRVSSGKFLGFPVSQRGIEINPDKIKAIEDIPDQLTNVKEVQRLTGRLAALSRFISRSSEKCHHFFSLLKKKKNFEWTPECRQALKDPKWYLSSPLLLSKLEEGEHLLIYLAVSKVAVRAVLVRDDKDFEVIKIKCDSQLVVNQVYGIFDTKEERMQEYVVNVQTLLARFREWSITHIPREDNTKADTLASLGSSTEMKGSDSGTVIQLMHSDWRNEIIDYLEHGKLPEDPKVSRSLRNKAIGYNFRGGQLYRRSFQGLLALCLGASEANYVMREVHEGICENHSGVDLLVLKLVRAGYYCPRMEQDSKAFI
uniref:RNase H type-1 domain-containing protein n=1 Tax=Nicotiana tabacum TaxID=4097 RepID=A0A1S4D838_TOBAC|nr:PREDICTED: uncharacterized protein LOC107826988 [Nicotiana tabacum]